MSVLSQNAVRTSAWARDQAAEAQLLRFSSGGARQFCFVKRDDPRLSPVEVWLALRDAEVYVSNIISRQAELDRDGYNSVLVAFFKDLVQPAVSQLGLRYTFASDHVSIGDLLPAPVAEKLKLFSRAANKATGSSHPLDAERWFDFMAEYHRSNGSLPAQTLARWLCEEEGWPEEVAARLASEFEFGVDLLRNYDKKAG